MHPPFAPLLVSLIYEGQVFAAVSFSEAGLTFSAQEAEELARLPRGRRLAAALHLAADGVGDHYAVEFRLASRTPALVEVTLVELPPQARLRLRHASESAAPEDVADAPGQAPAFTDGEDRRPRLSNGRRLIMADSLSVWSSSKGRRGGSRRKSVAPAIAAEDVARSYVLRGFAALAAGTLVLIILAAILIAGG